jgi:SAM-dependent methyltransferase
VILLDHDEDRLQGAVTILKSRGVERVEGRLADASRLPVPDEAATRVICTEVLEHVDDPAAVMAELVRIGRPGALYMLSVPAAVSERLQEPVAAPAYFQKPNHIRVFEADVFERLVEDSGLVIETRSAYGFYWTMWWLFLWTAGAELGQPHPLLDAWTRTWTELLRTPQGPQVKAALDALAPKAVAVVARKPV